MELLILGLFGLGLLLCLVLDVSILYALAAGLLLFFLYGGKKGFGLRELIHISFSGVKTVKNILITFLLIGIMTALWRDAGTIPVLVYYASRLIRPSTFLLMAFLLNCVVSVLTGTAFGTAATMGVICAAIASSLQISPALLGGAVLAGAYFGDRCSPVSTSALLVSELTGTSIFDNIRTMLKTALVPFLLSCAAYFVLGLMTDHGTVIPDLKAIFAAEFSLTGIALLPAVGLLVLSLLKVNVKIAMSVSILLALPICLFVQGTPLQSLPSLLLTGYAAASPEVASLLNGGGILSMVRVAAIVCLSSSYSGIFQKTGLLDGLKEKIRMLTLKTGPYTAMLCTAAITGMVACNQTLTIMLTEQLCGETEQDKGVLASHLENTAVIVAPLIPWSIACGVPLTSVGSPSRSVFFAFFLYLLPLCCVITEQRKKQRQPL